MLSKSPFDANLTQLIFNESKNALTKPIVRAFLLEIGCHSWYRAAAGYPPDRQHTADGLDVHAVLQRHGCESVPLR